MATPLRPVSPRKPARYTVPIKLWVSPEMYEALVTEAERDDWTVPQLIRRCIRDVWDREFEFGK